MKRLTVKWINGEIDVYTISVFDIVFESYLKFQMINAESGEAFTRFIPLSQVQWFDMEDVKGVII